MKTSQYHSDRDNARSQYVVETSINRPIVGCFGQWSSFSSPLISNANKRVPTSYTQPISKLLPCNVSIILLNNRSGTTAIAELPRPRASFSESCEPLLSGDIKQQVVRPFTHTHMDKKNAYFWAVGQFLLRPPPPVASWRGFEKTSGQLWHYI